VTLPCKLAALLRIRNHPFRSDIKPRSSQARSLVVGLLNNLLGKLGFEYLDFIVRSDQPQPVGFSQVS